MHVVLELLVLSLRVIFCCLKAIVTTIITPQKTKSITNNVALVTGGGRGIGRAISLELAKRGAIIVVMDLDQSGDETAELIRGNGGEAWSYICDVSNRRQVNETAAKMRSDIGRHVDILVNNAGVAYCGRILQQEPDRIQRTFDVNATSLFWTLQQYLPSMIGRNFGHVVVISSVLGKITTQLLSGYCSSKYAAHAFSEALVDELRYLKIDNVHVTTVYPLVVETRMTSSNDSPCFLHQSKFIPSLSANTVASAVVNAIIMNKRYVYLPSYMKLVNLLMLLPDRAVCLVKDYFGPGLVEVDNKVVGADT